MRWNNNDVVFAVLPECLLLGSHPAPFWTGLFPIYQGNNAPRIITGALTNMEQGYGYSSGRIYFDGVDDYILTNMTINITGNTTNLTIEMWLVTNTVANYITGLRDDVNNQIYIWLGNTGNLWFEVNVGGIAYRAISNNNQVPNGQYIHLTCRIQNGLMSIFVNGVEVTYSTQNTIIALRNYTNGLDIGRFVTNYYQGNIAQYIYYDNALTLSRIEDNYNLGANLGGLFGYDRGNGTMRLTDPPKPVMPKSDMSLSMSM